MKIALITDDGANLSKHFGRATHYLVVTIEDGIIIERSMREKLGHGHFAPGEAREEHHDHQGDPHRHNSMLQPISDCEVLICGGMGQGAYGSVKAFNIRPILTDLTEINTILAKFISGKLVDHPELLH